MEFRMIGNKAVVTAASQRGLHCRMILSAAPLKIGRRRPNQEAAQRLLNAGWQVKVMGGNRTLHSSYWIDIPSCSLSSAQNKG